MSVLTIDAMRRHFLDLCRQEGPDFTLRWVKSPRQAYCSREAREVGVAPITSGASYAAAVHELGHLNGRHQDSSDILIREQWAWEWARSAASAWTPTMERTAQQSLDWYMQQENRNVI